jgi:hypothetical protein
MVSRICWNCQFFVPDDPETLLTGVCRRHAPKAVDYQSYSLPEKHSMTLDMGHCLAAGTQVGEAVVPLFQLGAGDAVPASCHATDATGMDANDILPFSIPEVYRPLAVSVSASRANSGAATVGANPILKLVPINVGGTSQGVAETVEIPIEGANVQAKDTGTDQFFDIRYTFPKLNPIATGLVGFRVDLTGTTEDDIAQVRNLKIGLIVGDLIGSTFPSPVMSKAKFATISLGNTDFCGEFQKSTGAIPAIPVID